MIKLWMLLSLVTGHAALLTVELPARVVKVEASRLLVKFKTKTLWVQKDKVEPANVHPGDAVRVIMDGEQLAGAAQ